MRDFLFDAEASTGLHAGDGVGAVDRAVDVGVGAVEAGKAGAAEGGLTMGAIIDPHPQ